MLSWVVKVVPQPPEPPKKEEETPVVAQPTAPPPNEKKVTFKDEVPNADNGKDAQAAEGNRSGTAVLTWISSAMPQPVTSANKEESPPPSNDPENDKGMIAWIAQGLEKVVPHPELKNKDSQTTEPPVEVRPATAPAAPVTVEVKASSEEKPENKTSMINWIKQGIEKVVPQPEHLRAKTDSSGKTEAPTAPKVEAPPPQPPAPKPTPEADTPSTEQQTNMMGWIVNGIERILPQPVLKSDGGDCAQERGKGG